MRALADPAIWIAALNLGFIAALPRIFFRRGTLNLHWWLTAAPFFLAGAGLLFGHAMPPRSMVFNGFAIAPELAIALRTAGSSCAALSIALIAFTLGTHRQRVSLWHQEDDAPPALVTYGAYARMRHPFYAAFLLALVGCMLIAPSLWTAAALLFGVIQLGRTARREEARLLLEFGSTYAAYMRRTRRFVPRLSRG